MIRTVVIIASSLSLLGCATRIPGMDDAYMRNVQRQQREMMDNMDAIQAQSQIMQQMMSDPDLPAWHEQREKMALALGDRQFDKPFDRVFDSMTVALATLGCRVHNMERVSGYITASIPELPPDQLKALNAQGNRQYVVAKGYPADILDRKTGSWEPPDMSAMVNRWQSGLTLSMVKQGPELTKIKLRFDNIYYPGLVEEYYAVVWRAVDKQIFLDKGLD